MTVRINKPAINLREKLAELDKPSGLTGEELLRSQTSEEARNSLDLEEHLFENFESTGIDDNATSTKVTVSDSGVDVTGTVTADGLTVDGDAIAQSTSSSTTFEIKSGQEYATTGESKLVLRALNSASGTSYSTSEIVSVSSGGGDNDLFLRTTTDPSGAQNRIKIDSDGDISFYEDTGTTAKFVWDSSAETLTIGASSGNTNALRVVQSLDGTSSRGLSVEATTGHEFGIYRDANSDGAAHLRNNGIDTVSLKDGNVGIGTASPSAKIHLSGTGATDAKLQMTSGAGLASIDGRYGNLVISADENNAVAGSVMTFRMDGSERLRIDSSGFVGIATNNPAERLHIDTASTTNKIRLSTDNGNKFANIYSDINGVMILDANANGAGAAGRLGFNLSGTERARIDSSGNLLVGTTAFPTDDNTTLGFGVKSNGETRASTNGIPTLHLKRATSDGDIVVFRKNLASSVGSISITGSATSYNTSSDERLKENIQDTTHNVDINDIRVREFDWKTDGEHQRFGFIAQELETVYPEAVSTDDSEEQMKSVDYSKLVPLLVKEIQTLKARIETLENN